MKANVFEFAAQVDLQIASHSQTEYLRKLGQAKLLREELYPLSRLGLHLKQPGNTATVEAFEANGHADGRIEISGFNERGFEVQVTFAAYGYEDALRDELLATEGFSPGFGTISRNHSNNKIQAEISAADYDEHVPRISCAIVGRIKDKAKFTYADGTVLLVAFDEYKMSGRSWWGQLFASLDIGERPSHRFSEIYFFNCGTNEIYLYERKRLAN